MVSREQFIRHIDKIMDYHVLAGRITGLSGDIYPREGTQGGRADLDLSDIVSEMIDMLDECLDTPYVNTLDWEMTHRHNPEMNKSNYAEHTSRLIDAWFNEMDLGRGPAVVYDKDNHISVKFVIPDDLYDYLYITRQQPNLS